MLCTSSLNRIAAALALAAGALSAQTKPAAAKPSPSRTTATKPVWPDEGPRTWTPRPTVPRISANDLRTRLYGFADDSMLGRRVGEIGNYKGTDYVAREFKRLGLKPRRFRSRASSPRITWTWWARDAPTR